MATIVLQLEPPTLGLDFEVCILPSYAVKRILKLWREYERFELQRPNSSRL